MSGHPALTSVRPSQDVERLSDLSWRPSSHPVDAANESRHGFQQDFKWDPSLPISYDVFAGFRKSMNVIRHHTKTTEKEIVVRLPTGSNPGPFRKYVSETHFYKVVDMSDFTVLSHQTSLSDVNNFDDTLAQKTGQEWATASTIKEGCFHWYDLGNKQLAACDLITCRELYSLCEESESHSPSPLNSSDSVSQRGKLQPIQSSTLSEYSAKLFRFVVFAVNTAHAEQLKQVRNLFPHILFTHVNNHHSDFIIIFNFLGEGSSSETFQ